ncbi:hypothetical protein I0C86_21600 [Plantactinospora sp. S1510]|uniref:Uncharacterized protein n=1 Tax=Plantactinospora alkalitolerans TaxID=2789879 RepID=A0ABS0GZB2_9ACTN|nr:hypothetical protein [Plantactinospora alkalitolerans]MBF9131537.1 hypothetical protein [Plantactinospora alkalitolerans]
MSYVRTTGTRLSAEEIATRWPRPVRCAVLMATTARADAVIELLDTY